MSYPSRVPCRTPSICRKMSLHSSHKHNHRSSLFVGRYFICLWQHLGLTVQFRTKLLLHAFRQCNILMFPSINQWPAAQAPPLRISEAKAISSEKKCSGESKFFNRSGTALCKCPVCTAILRSQITHCYIVCVCSSIESQFNCNHYG